MNERKPLKNVRGNLTGEPVVRRQMEGEPVVDFTVAHTPRIKDEGDEWSDGPTEYTEVSVYGKRNVDGALKLHKGFPVVVFGPYEESAWEKADGREGLNRKVIAWTLGMDVTNVGAQVRWVPARERETPRIEGLS